MLRIESKIRDEVNNTLELSIINSSIVANNYQKINDKNNSLQISILFISIMPKNYWKLNSELLLLTYFILKKQALTSLKQHRKKDKDVNLNG